VDEVVAEFFVLKEDMYRHHRIDKELGKALDISEKRRAAAKVKHRKAHDANAVQMQVHLHTQSQSQLQIKKEPFRSDERETSDPRHVPIRELIQEIQGQTDTPVQWDSRCGSGTRGQS
jgi:uncharacterized protein YdaU (DUF1376 family)